MEDKGSKLEMEMQREPRDVVGVDIERPERARSRAAVRQMNIAKIRREMLFFLLAGE